MALETFQYIDDLVATNPTATDNVSQGDDHIRGIKTTLKNTFPNVTGAITLTEAEINNRLGNVSEDTTPQLGGDLDTNGNNINFGDGDRLRLGASNDLQLFHDGTNSYLKDSGTGILYVQGSNGVQILGQDTGESLAKFNENGSVQLYHNNIEKLETTSTGIDVTGTVTTDTARSADVVDNDGSFDLDAGTNFTCTPTGNITLTFTNIPDGQSGTIVLVNTGGYTISAAATTKVMGADMLTTITTAGTYVIGYISDGTNVRVYNSLAQQ